MKISYSKCKKCFSKPEWFYDGEVYCDKHLPCGLFKRLIGKYVVYPLTHFLICFIVR